MKASARLLVLLAAVILSASCNWGLEHRTDRTLKEFCAVGKLTTVQYTVTKIVKASDYSWWKIGQRKLLFSCKAYIEAGIDLGKFDPSKIVINAADKAIWIVLPEPEIVAFNMPVSDLKLVYEHVTGLRSEFTAEDRNNVLRQGEADIRAEIPKMSIMDDAKANAVSLLKSTLTQLGYEDINIGFKN